jgi:hypothetical protein
MFFPVINAIFKMFMMEKKEGEEDMQFAARKDISEGGLMLGYD